MIKILPLGGVDEIGASCFYLNIDGTGILLDCGIHPKKKGAESIPNFDLLDDMPLDYVLISHAHQDHIGALPLLIKRFPHAIIYTTEQTQEIALLTLHNAVNILDKEKDPDTPELYNHEEIDLLVRSIKPVDFNDEIILEGMRHKSNEPILVHFYDAGHILGSASILINYKDESIFYTGDIKFSDQQMMLGAKTPSQEINTIISETTYGSVNHNAINDLSTESKRLAKEANKILGAGGSILIPAFALGKTQEILAIINSLIESGKLTDVPIYTAGLGNKISDVYDKYRYTVRRKNKNLVLKDVEKNDLFEINDYTHFVRKPGIVIASSGMILENTTSFNLAKFWLRQKSFGIFLVGYMDDETPGFKIQNAERGKLLQLTDYGEEIKVNCKIEKFNFPSHSNRNEILNFILKAKPKNVILIHGEDQSRDWMGFNILKNNPDIKVYAPNLGSEIEL